MSVTEYTDQIQLWVRRILMNSWGTSQSCPVVPGLCNLDERKGGKKVVQQYTISVTNIVYESATGKSKVIVAMMSIFSGSFDDLGEAETLPGHK